MKLEKAIEIQTLYLQHSDQCGHHDLDDAVKLGIEGLKCIYAARRTKHHAFKKLLPGETDGVEE